MIHATLADAGTAIDPNGALPMIVWSPILDSWSSPEKDHQFGGEAGQSHYKIQNNASRFLR
jgi:hypothetical protein